METRSEPLKDPDSREERDQERAASNGVPSGTSLLQAIRCKYCSEPDDDDVSHEVLLTRIQETSFLKPGGSKSGPLLGGGSVLEFGFVPRAGVCPVQTRSTLVLEKKNITHCGACDELSALCACVKDLHIGGNALNSWESVSWMEGRVSRRVVGIISVCQTMVD